MGDLFRIVALHGIEEVYPIILLVLLRPYGLIFAFTIFSWAFGGGRMIRIAVAISLGLPTLALNLAQIETLVGYAEFGQMLIVVPKEIGLGLILGFLASLPFLALRYAGSVVAAYKGESDGGFQDPVGGTMESTAMFFQLVGMAAFVSADGLWLTIANLYESYRIWPLVSAFPAFAPDAVSVIIDILMGSLLMAIRTALPILAILIFIDFTLVIATRVGRRIRLYDHAFLSKNLIFLTMLPILVYILWIMNADIGLMSSESFHSFKALFDE